MALIRISGVNLTGTRRVEVGLTAIYGVGRKLSAQVLTEANINKDKKVQDLDDNEINKIREILIRHQTEGDLRRKITMDIKRLQEIGSYRGFRHKRGMPVRGQHTRKNARTRKGRKKTVANKKVTTK